MSKTGSGPNATKVNPEYAMSIYRELARICLTTGDAKLAKVYSELACGCFTQFLFDVKEIMAGFPPALMPNDRMYRIHRAAQWRDSYAMAVELQDLRELEGYREAKNNA